MNAAEQNYSQHTRFNSAGVRIEGSQRLDRDRAVAKRRDHHRLGDLPDAALSWPFRAEYALLSKRFGRTL